MITVLLKRICWYYPDQSFRAHSYFGNSTTFFTSTVAPGPPGKPTASDIDATSMTISWTPPESDGGAPITGYIIEKKKQSSSTSWEKITTNDVTGVNLKVTDLEMGSTYKFRVSAKNKVESGKPKESEKYTAYGKFDIIGNDSYVMNIIKFS